MHTLDSAALENAVTDESIELEQRDVRALTEKQTVLSLGGGIYSVTTESGSEYRVDSQEGRCTCPDFKHRNPEGGCKHLRRLSFARGDTPIPAYVNTDAVDPRLGEQLDDSPRQAAADGGSLGGRNASEESPREDCWCSRHSLPCFRHFEGPASTE
jgi:hypothetical protein